MQEDKVSTSSHFVTLTYDTKHIPISRNGFMTLDKDDVQKFFKRLRKAVEKKYPGVVVKYYVCGEYGGRTKRPHYHALIFNVPDTSLIEAAWQLGAIHYGAVTGASVGYTLKYMHKRKTVPSHRNDDRESERSLMSKGLGKSYLSESVKTYHQQDLLNRMVLTIPDGRKIAMPRYYKEKLYTEFQRTLIANYQKDENVKREERLRLVYGENYDRDLVQCHLQKFKKQERDSNKRDKL